MAMNASIGQVWVAMAEMVDTKDTRTERDQLAEIINTDGSRYSQLPQVIAHQIRNHDQFSMVLRGLLERSAN